MKEIDYAQATFSGPQKDGLSEFAHSPQGSGKSEGQESSTQRTGFASKTASAHSPTEDGKSSSSQTFWAGFTKRAEAEITPVEIHGPLAKKHKEMFHPLEDLGATKLDSTL